MCVWRIPEDETVQRIESREGWNPVKAGGIQCDQDRLCAVGSG